MNKRMGLIVLALCCVIFCSCSSQEEGEKNFAEKSALDNYSGIWSEDGASYEDIMRNGGGTLCIQFQQNEIVIEVQDFVLNDENRSGFGIDRTYVMLPMREQAPVLEAYDPSWSEERILEELENRKAYRDNCSFYSEVVDYMENIREVTDISMYVEPLYATDTQRYTEEDFADVPPLIIHLAKNEIYARHGYLFSNEDLYNYFMGQLWYRPSITKEEFDDSVFNECEIENIKLLANLDTYLSRH